jgi:ABC-type multidrug transport system ATPase subunit
VDNPVCFFSAHSMEEAEVLCDRLGIFVDGGFQCLGNPKEVIYIVTCKNK